MTAFTLDPSLEIRDVAALRTRLLAALDGGASLRVDVSPVVAVDSAGLQVLIALQREAQRRHLTVEFVGQSAALHKIATNLGVAPFEGVA